MNSFTKVSLVASLTLLLSACSSGQSDLADTASREFLDDFFSKDDDAAYCGSMQIEGADPETFHILADGYAADEDRVYYRVMQLDGEGICAESSLDPSTFVVFGEGYVGDATTIFNSLYGAVSDMSFSIDPASFEVLDATYVKDANGVYFLSWQDGRFEIEGADFETFEVTGDGYAKDKNHSYYLGKAVASAGESLDADIWKSYYNKNLDFQMDYPDTWTLNDSGFTKESQGLSFLTSLDPYEEDCLKLSVSAISFQYHEMDVTSKDAFVNKLLLDSSEAESTHSRPSWGGLITQDVIQYSQTTDGKELIKVEFDLSEYKPWSRKALCIGEFPPDGVYFVPYKEDWSEFLLVSIFNGPNPLVEQAILTLSW